MAMPFPPTHCCRCNTAKPQQLYTHTEWHMVGWMRDTINVPVPLCSSCYAHTLKVRRLKMLGLMAAIGIAIFAMYSFQQLNVGGSLLVWTLAFILYLGGFSVAAIWGIPRFMRPDFLEIDYKPSTKTATVSFTNPDYQANIEQIDKLATAAEKLFADADKKWGPPKQ